MIGIRLLVAVLLITALITSTDVAVAQLATLNPSSEFRIEHVGVVGSNERRGFRIMLSENFIAFEGEPDYTNEYYHRYHSIYFHDLSSRRTFDTGYKGGLACFSYPHMVLYQYEDWHGDLNGDGDEEDVMRSVYNVVTKKGHTFDETALLLLPCTSSGYVAYKRSEPSDDIDYNFDGDFRDQVVFVYEIENRTETNLGVGNDPMIFDKHVVWRCQSDDILGICIYDVIAESVIFAPITSDYPGAGPSHFHGDQDLLAFRLRHEDDNWLAYLNLSTGRLTVDKSVGVISGSLLEVSNGKIFSCTAYPLPSSCYVYDPETRDRYTAIANPVGMYSLHFSSEMLVFVDSSGAYIPWGPLPPPPNVFILDPRTGEKADTGLDGGLPDVGLIFNGHTIVAVSDEEIINKDVNGDGDFLDRLCVYMTTIGRTGKLDVVFVLGFSFSAVAIISALTVVLIRMNPKKRHDDES